ncbi:MAG: Cof-type HAD-IIB family hydrolase [Pseudobutyrivibrio sp.]|nr:Cof-type HAD-IIB family hydrolase [Pseudobutyrivibrio sp.]
MSKLIFFDIDGTLINFDGVMPESAVKALRQAQANGHKIILCTGRSKCQIEERLLNFGFDGMVAAAGAYVEYHDHLINAEYMAADTLTKLVEYFENHSIVYMIQCSDRIVSTTGSFEGMKQTFMNRLKDKPKNVNKIFHNQVEDDDLVHNCAAYENAEKACYYLSKVPQEQVAADLADEFDVISMSFKDCNDSSGEVSQKNITKAYGMKKLIDYLGCTIDDTVAFGDGPNDFEMIEFAHVGVAMGNANPDLKEKADMITSHITEDGIYNGMKELGLIG